MAPYSHAPLAGRGVRLGAAIIDVMILLAVLFPLYFAITFMFYPKMWDFVSMDRQGKTQAQIQREIEANQPSVLFGYGMVPLGYGIYLAINGYLLATNGQTVAKNLLGIKIVRTDGSPADLGRLFGIRYLPFKLIMLIPWLGFLVTWIINPLMIFRESRKCLHDDLADTIVVQA
ncbi:RDD family protein [Aeoliella mucimassa]|uniref:RDD family protein n=1 Tax=Aeoliella mucimassa TaxID=2527972 RepID=A0A518ATP2_9BACT|nr:RDD family protein [Aeoliella mucimassa]QDU58066.1 RDD family protein [Aeoliella mucimassa]